MDDKTRINLRKGEKAAIYSSLTNLLLAILKGIIGILSGSIALIADSVHSFSDIVASLAVFIGLRLSQRKPDEMFPYGYYKIESFVSLIVSAIIIVTGIEIALESFNAFINPTPIEMPLISLSVAAFSAVISFLLARYKEKVGRDIDSQALINDGKHSFIDIFSSLIVFVGILSSYLGFLSIEGISGILVAFLIVYMGLKLAKDDVLVLLDASMDPEKLNEIKLIAKGVEGVENVHDVKVRRSGPFVFAELHLETEKGLSVREASDITEKVKRTVKDEIRNLDTLTVQIEPYKKEKLRVAVPVENRKGLQSTVSEHFARAPYILFANVSNGEITDIVIKENPGVKLEKKKGLETADFLGKENVDVLIGNEVGEGPMYALNDKLIDVIFPKGKNLEEIILDVYK
ncbi:MAG: cation diffusion facilitator family transporter [Methanobacteriaceae archaeon]|jgi:cation diffusion facilitator family transporter|nr:cation diffusion facilitator family transporter [Methanobacteriaceae archaeon]OPY20485.1 MAG: ferrous iron efflux protein F [Methanobacterium sp. PtaU1.Bin097]